MTAIITDKQSIAVEIASALNIAIKAESEGYFQGRGFIFVWTCGELVCLAPPEDYGKKRLAADDLPFIPKPFLFTACKQKTAKGQLTDKAAVKQLNIIKKAFEACESIIVATDAAEEGELNFRRIYHYLECDKPFKRLWIGSLTAKDIKEGFKHLDDGALYDNLYAAADCREKSDFLFKTNASHTFSLSTGMVNYSLERIQILTLAMLCKRFAEHREFVSSRFFEHYITLEKDGKILRFKVPGTVKNKRKAKKRYERLKICKEVQITKIKTQPVIQPAPLLYNLTALQKDANLRYGFPAAKTMEIIRKLYEEKLISHPISDSRHIPKDVFAAIPQIIRQTAAYCELVGGLKIVERSNLNRRSVADIQAPGHHALIPTGVCPQYLSKDDKLIYKLIASRTLEAFAPDCQKEITYMEAVCGNIVAESKISEIIYPGWRLILGRKEDREENEAKQGDVLIALTKWENVCISGYNLLTRKIPKPFYTEESLLSAMEDASLGTVETRAGIIETLFSRDYIERRGKNLVPAEKGQLVYNCIKNMRIANVEMAGSWDKTLANINRGEENADAFMTMFEIFTRQMAEEILNIQQAAP